MVCLFSKNRVYLRSYKLLYGEHINKALSCFNLRSVIYPKIVKKCYSSCDKDSEDIKFAENGIRMRKLWLFELN